MHVIKKKVCCLCHHKHLKLVLKLNSTPPANEFVTKEKKHIKQSFFPLDVYQCEVCFHIQLIDIVDRSLLFKDYVYVSGTSPKFVEHFKSYFKSILNIASLNKDDLVVDIGSNDGTFLKFFKDHGCSILGIDPAKNIAKQATENGIQTLPIFFDLEQSAKIKSEKGKAKLISANNVFAHLSDFHDFTKGVKHLLANDGVFVFEVSYFVDVFEKTLFDTIYHEHTSYHTIIALQPFFEQFDLELFNVERVESHGGSIRCFVQHKGGAHVLNESITSCIKHEKKLGLDSTQAMSLLNNKIESLKKEFVKLLAGLKSQNKRIAGFGAPAKATTLLYHFEINEDVIDYIIDDSPLKQGLFSPGMHVPVVDSQVLKDPANAPDFVIVLAWNFAQPIIKNHQYFLESGGQFIIPLPNLEVVSWKN